MSDEVKGTRPEDLAAWELHREETSYRCDLCSTTLSNSSNFARHVNESKRHQENVQKMKEKLETDRMGEANRELTGDVNTAPTEIEEPKDVEGTKKGRRLIAARRPGKAKQNEKKVRTGFDGNWDIVVRKCTMTFSQHVSEVTTSQAGSRVSNDELLKRRTDRKTEMRPFQAMWMKSLSGLQASIPVEKPDKIVDITKSEYTYESIKGINLIRPGVSTLTPEEATASVIQQMNNGFMENGTFGQPINKDKLDNNFMANVANDQPLCEHMPLPNLDDEINAQEKRVIDARKRLAEVMKYFG